MRKRKKKEKREAFTRQEWEREFGEPLFSAVMQKKWREIFWSFLYALFPKERKGDLIFFCLSPILFVMMFIIFFDNLDLMGIWGMFLIAVGILAAILYIRNYLFCLVSFLIAKMLSKINKKIELVFYAESCCVYFEEEQFSYRLYMELEKIVILPADTWLIFEGRRTLLLPEHSITREQQKIIVEYLKKKKPDVKIEKRKELWY